MLKSKSEIKEYKALGLMSGTSLDGLDMAQCTFSLENGNWQFTIDSAKCLDYSSEWRQKLKDSVNLSGQDLLLLHQAYAKWIGSQCVSFIIECGIKPDFISSHGHTVFHQTDKHFTFQLGSGQVIANTTGIITVSDFRTQDVLLGGQGAPLVPIGDQHLFAEYDYCLNLGGIANVSFVQQGKRVALDTSFANMLLNHIIAGQGKEFDENGTIARSGKLDQELLDKLNSLEYCQLPFPKSLGYEYFLQQVQPLVDESTLPVEDKLHTAIHHIAVQLSKYVVKDQEGRMLVTGGGAHNGFLIETIRKYMGKQMVVEVPDKEIIDFKEALVFGFMGVLKIRDEVNCLRSVTGGIQDLSSGVIYQPVKAEI